MDIRKTARERQGDGKVIPRTREEARRIGHRFFHTGETCGRGHDSPRYTCNNRCRDCDRESIAARKAADPEKYAEISRRAAARWREKNPEKSREWRDQNRDKVNAATKRYRHRNPEKHLEAVRSRRERNREPSRLAALKWQQSNMDKKLALNAAQRAAKIGATPRWLTPDQKRQIRSFYTKAQTITAETGIIHHVDHIEPLRGKNSCGLHVPWNLQVIPWVDNLKKGNKLVT